MKRIIFYAFIFIAYSCKKDISTSPDNIDSTQTNVLTGIVNKNMFFQDLNPDVSPTISWYNCGFGHGLDSIDLYNDGQYDIFLDANFTDYQAYLSCCPQCSISPPRSIRYRIYSKNDVQFATYYEHFDYDYKLCYYVDTLSKNYQVDTIVNWDSDIILWDLNAIPTYGGWFYVEKDMYIGIRKGDSTNYKYGWILVGIFNDNNSNPYDKNFLFKEYAIEK